MHIITFYKRISIHRIDRQEFSLPLIKNTSAILKVQEFCTFIQIDILFLEMMDNEHSF